MTECAMCNGVGFVPVAVEAAPVELRGKEHPVPRTAVRRCDHVVAEIAAVASRRSVRVFGREYASLANLNALEGAIAGEAVRYLGKFREGAGLVILGGVGVGKSFVASAIANALLRPGETLVFATMVPLFEELKSLLRDSEENRGFDDLVGKIINCGLLVLDDLGSEQSSRWTEALLYQVVATRTGMKAPIIATANCDLPQLEERIGIRSLDRLMGACGGEALMMRGKSRRWRR